MTYGYDGVGNVTTMTDAVDPSSSRTLDYDGVDRLTFVSGGLNGTISYDTVGNVRTKNIGGINLTYNYTTTNRLTSVSGTRPYTFSYDVYGNITNNAKDRFTYNDASNMVCANCTWANKIEYAYDGNNMRVKRTQDGKTKYFVYAGNDLLLEYDPTGDELKEYGYVGGKQIAMRRATQLDTDGDRISDGLEIDNNFNPFNPADGAADADNDALANYREFEEGTDPFSNDTDGDGTRDGEEVQAGRNPTLNEAAILQAVYQLLLSN